MPNYFSPSQIALLVASGFAIILGILATLGTGGFSLVTGIPEILILGGLAGFGFGISKAIK
jgi:hypothetical protein